MDFRELDTLDREILACVEKLPGCRSGVLQECLGGKASRATILRRLDRLVQEGYVRRAGKGPAVRYFREEISDYLSVPYYQREPVSYDFERLLRYRPNESRLLPEERARSMFQAGNVGSRETGTYVRAIRERLLVDLSWASSYLEGNTYTYLDTEALVLYGQAASGRTAEETQMVLNHKEAIKYLTEHIQELEVSGREIKTLHALLANNLLDPAACGTLRQRIVGIGQSAYKPLDVPFQLEEQLELLVHKAREIRDPLEQSVFLLAFIAYLQPFEDVNKRTSRLAANIPLLKNGLCPLSFTEMDRQQYLAGMLAFYELGRLDGLLDAYEDSYMKSAERYRVDGTRFLSVQEQRFALRRRQEISAAIREVVMNGLSPEVDAGFLLAPAPLLPPEERDAFVEVVRKRLHTLNEANAVVYGLTAAEAREWLHSVAGRPPDRGPGGSSVP